MLDIQALWLCIPRFWVWLGVSWAVTRGFLGIPRGLGLHLSQKPPDWDFPDPGALPGSGNVIPGG